MKEIPQHYGQVLEDVEKFTYLGSTICEQGGEEEDIKAREGKASRAFVKLNRVWSSISVTRKTIKDQTIQDAGQDIFTVWL